MNTDVLPQFHRVALTFVVFAMFPAIVSIALYHYAGALEMGREPALAAAGATAALLALAAGLKVRLLVVVWVGITLVVGMVVTHAHALLTDSQRLGGGPQLIASVAWIWFLVLLLRKMWALRQFSR